MPDLTRHRTPNAMPNATQNPTKSHTQSWPDPESIQAAVSVSIPPYGMQHGFAAMAVKGAFAVIQKSRAETKIPHRFKSHAEFGMEDPLGPGARAPGPGAPGDSGAGAGGEGVNLNTLIQKQCIEGGEGRVKAINVLNANVPPPL